MIKKLILITGILLSTSLWADMDNRCFIYLTDDTEGTITEDNLDFIAENCERNNILQVSFVDLTSIHMLTSGLCRADRNVNVFESGLEDLYLFDCVLYDNIARKRIANFKD